MADADISIAGWTLHPDAPYRDGNFATIARNFAANANASLGTNMTIVADWTGNNPFINFMKQARDPIPTDGVTYNTGDEAILATVLDSDGYPTTLVSGDGGQLFNSVRWVINATPIEIQTGTWILLYDGEGTIDYETGFSTVNTSVNGRHVLTVTDPNTALVIRLTATTPANYMKNMRLIPPGGIADDDVTKYSQDGTTEYWTGAAISTYTPFEDVVDLPDYIWHPLYLEHHKVFRTLRFMDMNNVNGNPDTADVADRALLSNLSFRGANGVPVEAAVNLCNLTRTDMWYNFPIAATDAYINLIGQYIYDNLDASLTLYSELANELWNNGSPFINQQITARALGAIKWPDAVIAGEPDWAIGWSFYGARSDEMFILLNTIYTARPSKHKGVLCVQGSSVAGSAAWLVDTPIRTTYGDGLNSYSNAYALGIAPYFSGDLVDTATLPTLINWLDTEPDKGISKFLDAHTMENIIPAVTDRVVDAVPIIQTAKTVADSYGLKLFGYEGGQHQTWYGDGTGRRQEVLDDLIRPAHKDIRYKDFIKEYFGYWKAEGGELFCYFTNVSQPNLHGLWGAKESLLTPNANAPKYVGLEEFMLENPAWWAGGGRNVAP